MVLSTGRLFLAITLLLGLSPDSVAFTSPYSKLHPKTKSLFGGIAPCKFHVDLQEPSSRSKTFSIFQDDRKKRHTFLRSLINSGRKVRHRFLNNPWSFRLRRCMLALCVAVCLWFGSASIQSVPAHAVSSMSISQIEQIAPTATLDQMVDRYVQDHMFDEDVYNPVESAYKEAYEDAVVGQHPAQIKEITSRILGKDTMKEEMTGKEAAFSKFVTLRNFLMSRFGLSEGISNAIVGSIIFSALGAVGLGFAGGAASYFSAQVMITLKRRYGDDYTLDATAKPKPPPDDDDDDDDDDGQDDDDEDDDDK